MPVVASLGFILTIKVGADGAPKPEGNMKMMQCVQIVTCSSCVRRCQRAPSFALPPSLCLSLCVYSFCHLTPRLRNLFWPIGRPVMYGLGALTIPIAWAFPAATVFYWCINNTFSLTQVRVLALSLTAFPLWLVCCICPISTSAAHSCRRLPIHRAVRFCFAALNTDRNSEFSGRETGAWDLAPAAKDANWSAGGRSDPDVVCLDASTENERAYS